jgi:hypothetical protein
MDPDVAGGIRTVGRVRELKCAVPGCGQGIPVGGQPPPVSGNDGGGKGIDGGEGPVRVELVDPRLGRVIGPEEQQPSCLARVCAVDANDRTTAAADRRTQRHLGILLRRRRDAPHARSVVTRIQADGENARLSEPGVAGQRIPTVSLVQRILDPSKVRGGPGPGRDRGGTAGPRSDHGVCQRRACGKREHPGRARGILGGIRAGVVNEVAHPILDSVDHLAARDEPECVSVCDGRGTGEEGQSRERGSIGVDTIEVVDPVHQAPPPEVMAIDRCARRLDANDGSHVVSVVSEMSDDDLRVVVWRDERGGAGTRMIVIWPDNPVGVGSVVLLEPGALRGERRERLPRTVLGEGTLRANEAGRGDRLGYRRGRDDRGEEHAWE